MGKLYANVPEKIFPAGPKSDQKICRFFGVFSPVFPEIDNSSRNFIENNLFLVQIIEKKWFWPRSELKN